MTFWEERTAVGGSMTVDMMRLETDHKVVRPKYLYMLAHDSSLDDDDSQYWLTRIERRSSDSTSFDSNNSCGLFLLALRTASPRKSFPPERSSSSIVYTPLTAGLPYLVIQRHSESLISRVGIRNPPNPHFLLHDVMPSLFYLTLFIPCPPSSWALTYKSLGRDYPTTLRCAEKKYL